MRIMIIPAKRAVGFDEIKNFSGMWHHYINRELNAMGHETVFERGALPADPPREAMDYFDRMVRRGVAVDHVLGMSRYFTRIPEYCARKLQSAIPGAVTMIHDGPLPGAAVDQVFSIRDAENVRQTTHIGWAADADILQPAQGRGLRILIDHPHYHAGGEDMTNEITRQALVFKADYQRKTGLPVTLRRFCDGGVAEINDDKPVPSFGRLHIPFTQIAEEYGKAHLFVVTHPESLGQSVIEAAVAGAYIIAPDGFVRYDRMATVRSMTYRGRDVPWEKAVEMIDPAASRTVAMANNWRAVTERIVEYFKAFKK